MVLSAALSGNVLADLKDGLVAYYPFNGDAKDESGNGNDGTQHGLIEYVEGIIDQAIKLNGKNTYIRIANPSQRFYTQYTISGWVLTKGNGGNMFSKYSWNHSAGGNGFSFVFTTPDGNGNGFNGSTLFATGMFNESWIPLKYPSYTVPVDTFKHITTVYDKGNIKIYINGIAKVEKTISHNGTLNNPYDILIGTYFQNNGTEVVSKKLTNRTFDGFIDELRIYNRALSESEIQQLYNYQTCQPSIDIKLKVTGDKVVANSHIKGPSSSCKQSDVVETAWIKLPNNFVIPLIKPFTKLRLLPGSQLDTKIFDYTFSGSEPIGSYQFGGKLLHPFTADAISTDIEVLKVNTSPN